MATTAELEKAAAANGVGSQQNKQTITATPASTTTQTATPAAQQTNTVSSTTATTTPQNAKQASPLVGDPSQRVNAVNTMYDKNIENQKAQLQQAYDKNMSEAVAKRDNVEQSFNEQRNSIAAQYEKNRRNNNIQAANNGLNTGTASQMNLGQNNAYMSSLSKLGASEATIKAEADRDIYNLKIGLQNDMAQAQAQGDYQRAAAMLDEYNTQFKNAQTNAAALAQYGDFSGWAKIVGPEQAKQMQRDWGLQNPDLAIEQDIISEDDYFDMTGKHSRKYNRTNQASSGGGGARYNQTSAWWEDIGKYNGGGGSGQIDFTA